MLTTEHWGSDFKACYNCISPEGISEYERNRRAKELVTNINRISTITGVDSYDILASVETLAGPKPDLFTKYQVIGNDSIRADGTVNVFEQNQTHPYID